MKRSDQQLVNNLAAQAIVFIDEYESPAPDLVMRRAERDKLSEMARKIPVELRIKLIADLRSR